MRKAKRVTTLFRSEFFRPGANDSIRRVSNLPRPDGNFMPPYRVSDAGDRLVITVKEGNDALPCLFDVSSGKRIAILGTPGEGQTSGYRLHDSMRMVCTHTTSITSGQAIFRLYSLDDGRFLGEQRLNANAESKGDMWHAFFSRDGTRVFISISNMGFNSETVKMRLFQTSGFHARFRSARSRSGGVHYRSSWPLLLYWNTGSDLEILWNAEGGRQSVLHPD